MKTYTWDEIVNSHGVPIYYSSKSEGNNDFEKKVNFLETSNTRYIIRNYSDLFKNESDKRKILLIHFESNSYSLLVFNEENECIFDTWNDTINNIDDNIINVLLDNDLI